LGGESHFLFYVNLKYCGTNLAALREYLEIKDSSYTVKKITKVLDFFTKPFRYWKKPMLTRDFCAIRRKDFLSLDKGKGLGLFYSVPFNCHFAKFSFDETCRKKLRRKQCRSQVILFQKSYYSYLMHMYR
jgi:hypothetical protein